MSCGRMEDETLQERFERYTAAFRLSDLQMNDLIRDFGRQIYQALVNHKAGTGREEKAVRRHQSGLYSSPPRVTPVVPDADTSFLPKTLPYQCSMLFADTCVVDRPRGTEEGIVYAIDFGGTNLRVVRVELDRKQEPQCQSRTISMDELGRKVGIDAAKCPKGLRDANATAKQLFEAIALHVKDSMIEFGDYEKALAERRLYQIGFTFSYPMRQAALNEAFCTSWNKGWETGRNTDDPVEDGADIASLTNVAFDKLKVPARVAALLNDTTGTLLAAAYSVGREGKAAACNIGIIMGTGVNACYYEKEARDFNFKGSLINTECGGFCPDVSNPALTTLLTVIDHAIDNADSPGRQRLEKMTSGLYIPELCRRLILRIFQHRSPPLVWCRGTLRAAICCQVAYSDASSDDASTAPSSNSSTATPTPPGEGVKATDKGEGGRGGKYDLEKKLAKDYFDWDLTDEADLKIIHDICRAVVDRSAMILAAIIIAFAKKTGKLQEAVGGLTVAIDGTVYCQNPKYKENVRKYLNRNLGKRIAPLIKIRETKDGSGLGAAILAATALPHNPSRDFGSQPSQFDDYSPAVHSRH